MDFNDVNKVVMLFDGIRFNEPDIVFAIVPHDSVKEKLKNASTAFLERGDHRAGLKHILLRHYEDFRTREFDADGIKELLRHTIANLRPLNIVEGDRGMGLEYAFDDRLYPKLKHDTLKIAMGYNGFVVSAFVIGLSSVMGRLRTVAETSSKAEA